MALQNSIQEYLDRHSILILDGGLATTLEEHGCDLNNDLWSADVLLENPDAIRAVHDEFLRAGSDCITSSTYQATVEGFQQRGLSEKESELLLRRSVELAVEVRDHFWSLDSNRFGRYKPIVAISIGPYGAFLANGSEYTGDYGISDSALIEFHERRWNLLQDSGADVFACETIPSMQEARALLAVARNHPNDVCWISFTCADDKHLRDGTDIAMAASRCSEVENIAAIGINCTAPEHMESLIRRVKKVTAKPVIVYPNSGKVYDISTRKWMQEASEIDWETVPEKWVRAGASGIGGCCNVGPGMISAFRKSLGLTGAASH